MTPQMRSFSSNYVFPTLQSELSKLDPVLHPQIEYHKERDGEYIVRVFSLVITTFFRACKLLALL